MADNTEDLSLGNFSIENTMDMGTGDATLLHDLMSPETSTAGPDDIQEIVKEVKQVVPAEKTLPKGKEIVQKEEGEELTNQDIISNFLGDNEDEEEEVQKTEAVKSEEEIQSSTEDNTFTSLAKDLFKLGVFSKDDDDEEENLPVTPEEFLERFTAEKKKGAIEIVNNFIGQFGEDYQNAFEAIYVKGVNPKEYFGIYNNIVSFAELDLSQEVNQEKVMRQALTDQGFEAEDVTIEIDRLKNYGDLETVATRHHKVLVKREASKLQEKEQEAARELQQKTAIKNQWIDNVQHVLQEKLKAKEFDGIPVNPKLVNELQDFLLVDKWKTPSGETLTEFDKTILELKRPENHAMKVKVALLLKILEKDPTLSTIQRSAISKKTDQLFGEVARQVTKAKTTNVTQERGKSWFS